MHNKNCKKSFRKFQYSNYNTDIEKIWLTKQSQSCYGCYYLQNKGNKIVNDCLESF